MSQVRAFRLGDDDPNEIKANELLESWLQDGHNLRQIMTAAILNLNGVEMEAPKANEDSLLLKEIMSELRRIDIGKSEDTQLLREIILEAQKLVQQLRAIDLSPMPKAEQQAAKTALSNTFLENMKKTAKPGLKRE